MEHWEIKDLLPLAALERLEEHEAQAVSEHLRAGCDECEAELRDYREVAASLALALEPVGSHSRIMDRLQERLAASGASARQLRAIGRSDKLTRAGRSSLTGWRVATGIAATAFMAATVFAAILIKRAARSHVEFEQEIASREAQLRELHSQLTSSGK